MTDRYEMDQLRITGALRSMPTDELFLLGHWMVDAALSERLSVATWGSWHGWMIHDELLLRGEVERADNEPPCVGVDVLTTDEIPALMQILATACAHEPGLWPFVSTMKSICTAELRHRLADAALSDALADAADAEARALLRSLQSPPDLTGIPPWSKASKDS